MLARLLTLVIFSLALVAVQASAQTAADNAEARALFERGNDLFQQARAARGEKRKQLLRQALTQYVNSLQITRSRNAVFNAAVVSGELGRNADSYNYLQEYLRIEGLSDADRAGAQERQDALRAKVGLAAVTSEPTGAQIHIDRGDLAAVGQTPTEIALEPGARRVIVRRPGFKTAVRRVVFEPGQRQGIGFELEAIPVPVTIIVEDGVVAYIDDESVTPGKPTSVMPGEHIVRITRGEESAQKSIRILPGDKPQTIRLELPVAEVTPPSNALRNGAIASGATMIAAVGVGVGMAFRARNLRDEFDQAAAAYQMSSDPADKARAESLADDVDRANITADAMFALSGAAGVTGLVLYLLHRKRVRNYERERAAARLPELQVGASRDGAMLQATWKWGAAK